MEKTFEGRLNSLLMYTFRDILRIEELILQRSDPNLSINEVHLIETVRKGKNRSLTISEIAAELRRAVPSVTVAVNKLVDKGYLIKEKNIEDARSYQVKLTREGEKIYRLHMYIHLKLVREAAAELSDEEKETLLVGVKNLDDFFKKKIDKYEKYGGINEFSNRRNRKVHSGSRTNK
ncbi:MAG: MarR family transcriptional regulator [Clostridiales bacterium]|nr:MarR family transcriptional regulator [Clostridiales bacterium]